MRSHDGMTLSSDGEEVDDDDDDDDSSDDEEKLNADGSVILTGRRGRVSLLHETQMTQRRTSFKGQAMREATERQMQLERVTRVRLLPFLRLPTLSSTHVGIQTIQ